MALKRVHLKVYGLVQGVGFRWFTERKAKEIGVNGWVKNLWDGSVEIVAEGDEEDLKVFIEEIKKGPPLSRVDKIEERWEDYRGEFDGFEIRF